MAGLLAIAITVSAIIVELAATRYNYRITWLFVSEPINIAAMSLFVVTTLQCVWVGVSRDTGETAHLPGAAFGVTLCAGDDLSADAAAVLHVRVPIPLAAVDHREDQGLGLQVRAARATQPERSGEAPRDGSDRRIAGRRAQRDRAERSQHRDGVRQRAEGTGDRLPAVAPTAAGNVVRRDGHGRRRSGLRFAGAAACSRKSKSSGCGSR